MSTQFLRVAPLALLLMAQAKPVDFEPSPRVVATGQAPVLAIRASGAVSLLNVENGDLWIQTSFDGGDTFQPGVRVNDTAGEVASHGENTPQLQLRSRSELYCLWQARSAGLRFARSVDWAETFSKPIPADPSGPPGSQGFFTMNVSPAGTVYVAWLDGRDRSAAGSSVYIARSTDRGVSFEPSVKVAERVCPCCRPSIAFGAVDVVHVAWRGVSGDNVRDIHVSTSTDGGKTWPTAVPVSDDHWEISGCPHSGAALESLGGRLFIAWYSAGRGDPGIYLASSDDGGRTFSKREPLSGSTLDPNHPYFAKAQGKLGVVFQARDPEENRGWGRAAAYYREIDSRGRLSPLVRIGQASGSASYPVLAFEAPGRTFAAWTESMPDRGYRIVLCRGRETRPSP